MNHASADISPWKTVLSFTFAVGGIVLPSLWAVFAIFHSWLNPRIEFGYVHQRQLLDFALHLVNDPLLLAITIIPTVFGFMLWRRRKSWLLIALAGASLLPISMLAFFTWFTASPGHTFFQG